MDSKSLLVGTLIGAFVVGAYPLYRQIAQRTANSQLGTYELVTECTSMLAEPYVSPESVSTFLDRVQSHAPEAAIADAVVTSVAGDESGMGHVLRECVTQLQAGG